MIDLASLATLFVEVSKEWREPKIARIEPLEEIEKEDVYLDLKAKGHPMQWVNETRLRQLARAGWIPVVARDRLLRSTIFMDRKQELVLVHRPPRAD